METLFEPEKCDHDASVLIDCGWFGFLCDCLQCHSNCWLSRRLEAKMRGMMQEEGMSDETIDANLPTTMIGYSVEQGEDKFTYDG